MRPRPTIDEVAEHFEEYIGRVVDRGESFVLTKDRKPVAELRPAETARLRLGDLPALLSSLPHLDPDDASEFASDLAKARQELNRVPLRDPWES